MTTIAKKYSVRPLAMVDATDTASVSGVVSNGLRADAVVSCRPVSCCATPDGNGVMVTATVTASSCALCWCESESESEPKLQKGN